jgi:diacylglycerol kinase family enzyme
VQAPEGFAFLLDGEIVEQNGFTIEICPAAIRFAVPATKNAEEQPATEKEPVTV